MPVHLLAADRLDTLKGRRKVAVSLKQASEVVEASRSGKMLGAEHLLLDRQPLASWLAGAVARARRSARLDAQRNEALLLVGRVTLQRLGCLADAVLAVEIGLRIERNHARTGQERLVHGVHEVLVAEVLALVDIGFALRRDELADPAGKCRVDAGAGNEVVAMRCRKPGYFRHKSPYVPNGENDVSVDEIGVLRNDGDPSTAAFSNADIAASSRAAAAV
jgi:hypothetical protein